MLSDPGRAVTVMVTGVGAIIGQGIIRSLRMDSRPFTIVGLDRNPDAFGKRDCDKFLAKPASDDDSALVDFLIESCETHGIDILIPGIEQDVYFLDRNRSRFHGGRTKIVLNTSELISMGRDKWETYNRLISGGHRAIPTRIDGDWRQCLDDFGSPPVLLKPRQGTGGRGIELLYDAADFQYWRDKLGENFMVQKLIGHDDAEYTISVFGYGDGASSPPAILRRRLGAGGATWEAETVAECSLIEHYVAALTSDLKPLGPTNFQCRIENDQVYLLEVNPRISASTSMRAALGVNEAVMCVEYFLFEEKIPSARLRRGRACRYVEDVIEIP